MTKGFSRRNFLRALGVTTCTGLVHTVGGPGLTPLQPNTAKAATPGKILVVFYFGGGFPLNICPLTADYWIDRFQDLSHPGTALTLDGVSALHPSMTSLLDEWNDGKFAMFYNVGYADSSRGIGANRSHSNSTDIFLLGRPDVASPTEGIGARITNQMGNAFSGVSLDGTTSFLRNSNYATSVNNLNNLGERLFRRGGNWNTQEEFFKATRDQLQALSAKGGVNNVTIVKSSIDKVEGTLELLETQTDPDQNPLPAEGLFPNTSFGRQCRDAARIANAPVLENQVMFIRGGGFDTHRGELASLTNRLNDWNQGISAFNENLKQIGRYNDTCCVTMADFGRTSFRNGSGGTDHGHSMPYMVWGGNVIGGIKNAATTLEDLVSGNTWIRNVSVQHSSLLGQIVEEHLGCDASQVFPGYAPSRFPLFG